MITMRIKVKLRPLVELFHLENIAVREVFNGILSEELMNKIEDKYPTLGAYQEAEKRELVSITNSKLYEAMKEAISNYVEERIIESSYVTEAEYIPMPMRVAYGKLASDLELYFYPILKLQGGIMKLSNDEKIFLDMYYCLNGESKVEESEISKKINLKISVDEYKKNVLKKLLQKIN